jgi:hypothetical protein
LPVRMTLLMFAMCSSCALSIERVFGMIGG